MRRKGPSKNDGANQVEQYTDDGRRLLFDGAPRRGLIRRLDDGAVARIAHAAKFFEDCAKIRPATAPRGRTARFRDCDRAPWRAIL